MSLAVLGMTKKEYEMDCAVWARIHVQNEPSQRMFAAAGFNNLGVVESGDLEVWVKS